MSVSAFKEIAYNRAFQWFFFIKSTSLIFFPCNVRICRWCTTDADLLPVHRIPDFLSSIIGCISIAFLEPIVPKWNCNIQQFYFNYGGNLIYISSHQSLQAMFQWFSSSFISIISKDCGNGIVVKGIVSQKHKVSTQKMSDRMLP